MLFRRITTEEGHDLTRTAEELFRLGRLLTAANPGMDWGALWRSEGAVVPIAGE